MIPAEKTVKWLKPAQVLMTLCVLVAVVMICQFTIVEFSKYYSQQVFRGKPSQIPVLSEAERYQKEIREARKEFLFDGTAVLVQETGHSGGPKTVRVADANNRTLYDGPEDKNPYSYISWSDKGPYSFDTSMSLSGTEGYRRVDGFSEILCIHTVGPDMRASGTWVYDPALRAFTGHNLQGQVTGYLDAQGLCLRKQDIQPLEKGVGLRRLKEADAANMMAVWLGVHSAYLIDFEAGTVKRVFHSEDDPARIVQVSHWDAPKTGLYLPIMTVSRESGQGTIFIPSGEQGERLIQIHVPPEWSWEVAATRSGVFLRRHTITGYPQSRDPRAFSEWWEQNRARPKQHIEQLMEVRSDGNLKPISSFEWTQPGSPDESASLQARLNRRISQAIASFSPLPSIWLPRSVGSMDRTRLGGYLLYMILPLSTFDMYGPSTLAVTLVLAFLTFLHARPRRTGWGSLTFWIVFVLAFNLAGLLTYLALNHTPVIRCPACGRRRGLLRPDCPSCHAHLPAPERRPTDLILATAQTS
jgi:hypothetical protein